MFFQYYFGDFNLMKDKFLKQEIQKDDGWVPLATLLNFNRLAALTKDIDVILSAFKENPSELVEVIIRRIFFQSSSCDESFKIISFED